VRKWLKSSSALAAEGTVFALSSLFSRKLFSPGFAMPALWQKQDGYSQAAVLNGLFHREKGHFMKFIEATPFLFLP
jgi:hypothetical protein